MINIRGLKFKVMHFTPDQDDTYDDLDVPMGVIDHGSAEIFIRGDGDIQVQQQTFIHEAVHGLTFNEAIVDESLVNRLGADIFDFLIRNDLLREGWWDNIIDGQDDERGRQLTDAIDTIRHMDRTETQPIPR